MGSPWQFATDGASDTFCREIAAAMVRLFGVGEAEAVGRINRQWRGQDILGDEDIAYHETAEYWAHVMYYGKGSFWWVTGEKRAEMGLGSLAPTPYP